LHKPNKAIATRNGAFMTARSLVTNGASATISEVPPHQRDDAGRLDANTLLTVLAEVERGDFTTRMRRL
jgi:hypothetical protein